ncbi:hypothetical protein LCGC14_2369010 [marine sediment metagenome]|uniref:Uncharacterized protein n=1 Tax=marine sediment metagenome TaxID=412755 RepID=A0A0F9EGT9_9ZZZZ
MNETEDSEVIEVEVRAHRRKIRRKRYRRTCDCPNESQTLTAPAPPKLIPKGRYGVSVWVHLLLAKFASHRALGNAIEALSHYDLDLPQGTITDGLKPHFSPAVRSRILGGVWAWHEHGVTMGANSWKKLRKDGRLVRYAGAAGVAIRSRGGRMRTGYSSRAVAAARGIIKSTDATHQQSNTRGGGARRMLHSTAMN